MPTIRITDEVSIDLETGATGLGSTFEKYLKGRPLHLVATHNAAQFFRQRLAAPAAKALTTGLSFKNEIELGSSGATLAVRAGAPLSVAVFTAEDESVVQDQWFSTVGVPTGKNYVALTFAPTLGATLALERGPLGFGFTAGTSIATLYAEPFAFSADDPRIGACCLELLERHGLPGDLDDLARLPTGALASVASEGTLTVSSTFALVASPNPLASASLPVVGGISVTAGASIEGSFTGSIRGAFEIRVWKSDDATIHLGYFRRKDVSWSAEVSAQVGVGAGIGDRDILATLLGAVFGKPKVDIEAFLNADLTPEQIDAIQALVKASVNRTLTLSLNASFSGLGRSDAAFEYEITPARLTAASRAAVEAALDGDLARLQALDATPAGAPGVKVLKSLQVLLKQRTTAITLNLFGLLNAASVREFLRESRIAFDEESGGLVLADTISSKRLGLVSKASRVESERLRKVLLESVIATASYRAGGLAGNVGVDISQQYFEFHRETGQTTMRDNVECLVALGLITSDEMEDALRPSLKDYGPSTFLVETTLPPEVCRDLFLAPGGDARPVSDYEAIGRDALLAFVPPGTHDAFRRVIGNPGVLTALKAAGSDSNMMDLLSRPLGHGSEATVKKHVVVTDAVRIIWWAESMHDVGTALAKLVAFIGDRDPAALKGDTKFVKARRGLENALATMVKHSDSKFGDPWGLVAVDLAGGRRGGARAIVAAPTLTIQEVR
jgi:hypothetical protein